MNGVNETFHLTQAHVGLTLKELVLGDGSVRNSPDGSYQGIEAFAFAQEAFSTSEDIWGTGSGELYKCFPRLAFNIRGKYPESSARIGFLLNDRESECCCPTSSQGIYSV